MTTEYGSWDMVRLDWDWDTATKSVYDQLYDRNETAIPT